MTGLKQFVLHQLHEMRREFLVALEALSEEDLTSHEPHGRSPIAWIVEHCAANVDIFLVGAQTGEFAIDHDRRFTAWPIIDPQPGEEYPPPDAIAERWRSVCDTAIAAIGDLSEADLQKPGAATTPSQDPEPMVESCLRVINHQNAHLRQIWCTIGRRGIDRKYPRQRHWLAAAPEPDTVLLEDVVEEFREMTGDLAGHQVLVAEKSYPQPHVYLVMHLLQMHAAAWRADFDRIAAVSGASALFAYQPRAFMPKYAHLHIGIDDRIAEATGFGHEWVSAGDAEEAWGIIRGSLLDRFPVKGWHRENLLFAGFRGREDGREVFVLADGPETLAEWWDWCEFAEWFERWSMGRLGRFSCMAARRPPREVALRVMRDLVEWSEQPPREVVEEFPDATFGLRGMERYAEDCANVKEFPDWGTCHDINPQWTLRNSTAVCLEDVAASDLFEPPVGRRIASAAARYRDAYRAWAGLYEQLGHGAPDAAGSDPGRRARATEAIRHGIAHERAALAHLREALAEPGPES